MGGSAGGVDVSAACVFHVHAMETIDDFIGVDLQFFVSVLSSKS